MITEDQQRQAALAERAKNMMNTASRSIWVTFSFEGLHLYPAAKDDPNLKRDDEYDVGFLGYQHRHIFHFKVEIEVFHNDRDIEFIQFKRWCQNQYNSGALELNSKSCEMLADDLFEKIAVEFPGRKVVISVAEDNENGCTINYHG